MEKMAASQRLLLIPAEVVPKWRRNGLQCVFKDSESDRLIVDARPSNAFERPLRRWTKLMGHPAALAGLSLPSTQVLSMFLNDVKDFYYQWKAGPARASKNAFALELTSAEAAKLDTFPSQSEWVQLKALCPSLPTSISSYSGRWLPAFRTLPMGDVNAVEFAQAAHLGLATIAQAVTCENIISLHHPLPRARVLSGIIIDDHLTLER
jgi:hypothetical protein